MKQRQKILIVEDELINRELLSIFLRNDYDLTFSDRLDEATAIINQQKFNLIITDIRLSSRLDGLVLLKSTRESALNKSTSVVAYTASDNSINQRSYAEEGFDGFIAKPVMQEALLKKVSELLSTSN